MATSIDTETLEPLQQMREVALQVFQEQRDVLWREIAEGEIGRMRHTFEEQFRQVWAAIQALTEAQQRTEERLSRLEATVQALAEAQRRAEERLSGVEERLSKVEERLSRLEATVQALAEAQRRAEERLSRLEATVQALAEAQRRAEERLSRLEATVQALAEAQRRAEERLSGVEERLSKVEERLSRLEATVQALAEAQRRTEEELVRLAEAQRHTEERLDDVDKQLSTIGNILGLDAEGDAEEILTYILERKGYRILAAPHGLDIDGEVDLVMPVETPEGTRAWVVLEAKKRVRLKELRRWANRVQSKGFLQRLERAGVTVPLLPYLFGLRVYAVVDEEAKEKGIGVLCPDGERVVPRMIRKKTSSHHRKNP